MRRCTAWLGLKSEDHTCVGEVRPKLGFQGAHFSRPLKFIEGDGVRSYIHDFSLVIHSNHGPLEPFIRYTAISTVKCKFLPFSVLRPKVPVEGLNVEFFY